VAKKRRRGARRGDGDRGRGGTWLLVGGVKQQSEKKTFSKI
jgi:hypothetical protein